MTKKTDTHTPHIVTIGGGTGHFTILSGLRDLSVHTSAIVTMADDGGSTGRLRDSMGVLPPGDVRRCLVALSKEREVLRQLFGYRFDSGAMDGHSLGNLFLAALEKITGSFGKAAEEAARVLNVAGAVLPVTEEQVHLKIELNDGAVFEGQHKLNDDEHVRSVGLKRVSLVESGVRAYPPAVTAIREANMVVIGPGDLHDSIMPNLLVPEIATALQETAAKVVFAANLTNKKGQTDGYTIDTYVSAINELIGSERVDVVLGNNRAPHPKAAARYERQEGAGMLVNCSKDEGEGRYTLVCQDVLADHVPDQVEHDTIADTRSFIRHDPHKLAAALMEVLKDKAGS